MKLNGRHTVFKGLIIDIEEMQVEIGANGSHTFQVIRHPGGAGVLPVHDDGTVTLIRQLRPAVAEYLLEIPAGRLDAGELPIECARRELREETGISAAKLIPLGSVYSSPGVFDEIIHLYAATGTSQGEIATEDDEEIETVRLTFDEAMSMAVDGRINDAKTVTTLFRWKMICPITT